MGAANSTSNTSFSRCLPLPVSFFDPPDPKPRVSNNFSLFFGEKNQKGMFKWDQHI